MEFPTLMGIWLVLFANQLLEIRSEDKDWNQDDKECAKDLHLNLSDLEVYAAGLELPKNNSDVANFIGCSWTKSGVLDVKGEILWNNVLRNYEQTANEEFTKDSSSADLATKSKVAKSSIKACRGKNLKGSTPGQTAIRLYKCLKDEIADAIAVEFSRIS